MPILSKLKYLPACKIICRLKYCNKGCTWHNKNNDNIQKQQLSEETFIWFSKLYKVMQVAEASILWSTAQVQISLKLLQSLWATFSLPTTKQFGSLYICSSPPWKSLVKHETFLHHTEENSEASCNGGIIPRHIKNPRSYPQDVWSPTLSLTLHKK